MSSKFKLLKVLIMPIIIIISGLTLTVFAYSNTFDNKKEIQIDSKDVKLNIKQPSIYLIDNNNIFYVNLDDFCIYSINLKNRERKNIYNGKVCEEGILTFNGYIYFKDKADSRLYRIKEDGTDRMQVTTEELGRGYEGFFVCNDSIIYYDVNDKPHKIDKENKVIGDSEKNIFERISLYSKYYNGILYEWGSSGITAYNLTSQSTEKIVDDSVYNIPYIDDNYIYYINNCDCKLHRITINGKNNSIVSEDKVLLKGPDCDFGNVEFINNKIYYISYNLENQPSLYSLSLTDNIKELILKNINDFRIKGMYLYYVTSGENGALHSINLKSISDTGIISDKVIDPNDVLYIAGVEKDFVTYAAKSGDSSDIFGKLYAADANGNKFELK